MAPITINDQVVEPPLRVVAQQKVITLQHKSPNEPSSPDQRTESNSYQHHQGLNHKSESVYKPRISMPQNNYNNKRSSQSKEAAMMQQSQ